MSRAALLVVACVALVWAGCGDDARPAPPRGPELPFPPKAFEPGEGGSSAVRGQVRVGGRPEGIAISGGLVGVGVKGRSRDELVVIDLASQKIVRRVAIPSAPRHVSVASDGRFLVPAEEADELAFVDGRTGEVESVEVGDNPHDASGARDGTAYTADEFGGSVTEVRDGRAVRSAPVDAQPGGVAVIGDDKLAMVSVRAYTMELFDRRTLRGEGSQNIGYGPSHVAATRDGRLFAADTRGNGISVFTTDPALRFAARVPVPGSPYGLALDERRRRLWVTSTARNRISEIRTEGRPRVVRTIPTVQQPNTIAADPATGRLAVASATQGTVQILDP